MCDCGGTGSKRYFHRVPELEFPASPLLDYECKGSFDSSAIRKRMTDFARDDKSVGREKKVQIFPLHREYQFGNGVAQTNDL